MKVEVRDPRPGDWILLGENLRDEDIREIAGLIDVPHPLVIKTSIEQAHWVRVVTIDDRPVTVFGVTREPGSDDYGLVWLLSTPGITEVRWRFLRESKAWLDEMFRSGPFNRLRNIADHRNELHIKWLRWLGADFHGDMIRQHYQKFEFRR